MKNYDRQDLMRGMGWTMPQVAGLLRMPGANQFLDANCRRGRKRSVYTRVEFAFLALTAAVYRDSPRDADRLLASKVAYGDFRPCFEEWEGGRTDLLLSLRRDAGPHLFTYGWQPRTPADGGWRHLSFEEELGAVFLRLGEARPAPASIPGPGLTSAVVPKPRLVLTSAEEAMVLLVRRLDRPTEFTIERGQPLGAVVEEQLEPGVTVRRRVAIP